MAQQNAAKGPKAIRKITVKTVYGKIDLRKLMETEKLHVMDVYGIANNKKQVETDYGTAIRFIGQFRAVNPDTGEMFQSSRLYLPSQLADDLDGALQPGATAEFAVRVECVYDESIAVKYYFDGADLVKPANNDAMTALENKMKESKKLLEAPKKGK